MKTPSATHTSFAIEREFAAPPERVFAAWADPEAREAWLDCHAEHTIEHRHDFRPQGREVHRVRYPDGNEQCVQRTYFDIVADRRIVFAYDIAIDGRRLSVSLVTVDFMRSRAGTRMLYTEQLAYLDGHEDRAQRMQGTAEGLDRLALFLQEPRNRQ
jgi:uncharacterized protein YndB with AHSA1/START domain